MQYDFAQFPPEEAVTLLRDQALERGGKDNVTILICKLQHKTGKILKRGRRTGKSHDGSPLLLMTQILFSGLIFKLSGATEIISWAAICRWGWRALAPLPMISRNQFHEVIVYGMVDFLLTGQIQLEK